VGDIWSLLMGGRRELAQSRNLDGAIREIDITPDLGRAWCIGTELGPEFVNQSERSKVKLWCVVGQRVVGVA